MNLDKINLNEVKAELCRRSLFYFLQEFWSEIISDKLHINWHMEFICDEFQRILEAVIRGEKENDDLVINICPGTSKSTIVIMAQAWFWVRKPDAVILSNTISTSNATEFSQKFRDIVTSEKYQKYFPYIQLRNDSTAFMRLKNTSGGARRQYTTKSRITGDHGHVRFDDDQMAFQDARSDKEVEVCLKGYKAYSTREKKNARVPYILVMQRLSDNDTSSYVFKTKPNVKKIVLPAWDNGLVYPAELRKNYVDGLLNPFHINKEFLDNKRKELGDLQYMCEYGQDTTAQEGLLYQIQTTQSIEKKGLSIAVCDPADDGDCYTASVFAFIHSNKIWIYDVIYTQDNSDITINRNAEKAKLHKPFAFFIEKDGLGNIYGKQVKNKYPLVQQFNAKGNKDLRINNYSNIISSHCVFLENSNNLEYENARNAMTSYKRSGQNKFKDFQDALTSLVQIAVKNNYINPYVTK